MGKTLIGFTDNEIRFAIGVLEFSRHKLQERYYESHSGIDQLLINDWIIQTTQLLGEFKNHLPKVQPVVYPEGPEA